MNQIVVRAFDFSGQWVRTAGTFHSPLFCAADVCDVLGIEQADRVLGRLDQEDVVVLDSAENGSRGLIVRGAKPNAYVTESGLFSLILGSRKPQARPFKRWVTAEVLPEIRKYGVYDAVAVQERKAAERLLAECFPNLPSKSAPIFRELIAALLRVRGESGTSANPPWARSLASSVYEWAIQVEGQQEYRREKNPTPNGSRTDHSMFSQLAEGAVRRVVQTGCDLARLAVSWEDWKTKMEYVFGRKELQLPLMVPMLATKHLSPDLSTIVRPSKKRGRKPRPAARKPN